MVFWDTNRWGLGSCVSNQKTMSALSFSKTHTTQTNARMHERRTKSTYPKFNVGESFSPKQKLPSRFRVVRAKLLCSSFETYLWASPSFCRTRWSHAPLFHKPQSVPIVLRVWQSSPLAPRRWNVCPDFLSFLNFLSQSRPHTNTHTHASITRTLLLLTHPCSHCCFPLLYRPSNLPCHPFAVREPGFLW